MRPALEHIAIETSSQSFNFFKRSETTFLPFWHYHPELELTLITKGQGTRFVGDAISTFSALDLVLVGENLPHHWVSASKVQDQEAFVFQFEKSLFQHFAECSHFRGLFEEARHGIHFAMPGDALVEKIMTFKQLSALSKLSALMEILQLLYLEKERVPLASDHYVAGMNRPGSQAKVAETTNYILEHLDEKLTVQRMADFTHMVPQSFCRWFKRHSGHSFVAFVNKSRVELTCQLLLTTNRPIQEIAFDAGFDTLSHFNRTFQQLKNCSPSVFRKSKMRTQH